jgi:predicted lipid-binding transport protein (Tim44 family)
MKNNKWMVPLLGIILMGLSTWVLITLVELQSLVAMLQQEILGMDKVIGRIYAHMDRLMDK